jgi:hypothetical protein
LIGLQLPVFAMDFPMDPSPGFRGDSALNSGPWLIEPHRKRSAQPSAAGGSSAAQRAPRGGTMRERSRPVKIPVLLQWEATRTGEPAAHRAQESGARRAVHQMAPVGIGMSLAPTRRLAPTNSGEEWS